MQNPDLLSPYTHQNIIILFSNICAETAFPCQGPEVNVFEYYGVTDYSIGQFVEESIRCATELCEVCKKPQSIHYKSYVHGNGHLSIAVQEFVCPLPGMHNTMLMWSFCKDCKTTTPVLPLSESTWKFSFGKYLELSFYSSEILCRATMCPHDLHKRHVRYFGYQNWAVRVQYDSIDILSLIVPSTFTTWDPKVSAQLRKEEFENIELKIKLFYDSVVTRLNSISSDIIPLEKREMYKLKSTELLIRCRSEKEELIEILGYQWDSTPAWSRLSLNGVLRSVQQKAIEWDQLFLDFEKEFFLTEKEIRRLTAAQLRKVFADRETSLDTEKLEEVSNNEFLKPVPDSEKPPIDQNGPENSSLNPSLLSSAQHSRNSSTSENRMRLNRAATTPIHHSRAPSQNSIQNSIHTSALRGDSPVANDNETRRIASEAPKSVASQVSSSNKVTLNPSNHKPPLQSRTSDTKVQQIAKQFDLLTKEYVREQMKQKEQRLRSQTTAGAAPVFSSKPKVELYQNVEDAVKDISDEELERELHHPEAIEDPHPLNMRAQNLEDKAESITTLSSTISQKATESLANLLQSAMGIEDANQSAQAEKGSIMKAISTFWMDRTPSSWTPLRYPLVPTAHMFSMSDVIVREDEPSSLIAFTLDSEEYCENLGNLKDSNLKRFETKGESSNLREPAKSTPTETLLDIESVMSKDTSTHMRYQFQEGPVTFYCKVFYAEQFDAIRQRCGCRDYFVESLSRCLKWDSSGGKSGSAFLKTLGKKLRMFLLNFNYL